MEQFDIARQLMQSAHKIVIVSHRNPDADAVGANLALREALEMQGKEVTSACIDPIPDNCDFLRGADDFTTRIRVQGFDLVITVDCGAHKLVGFHEEQPDILNNKVVPLLNIDHHPSNDDFGTVNIVMPDTPATCFILYLMFNTYGWNITPSMATALLHGLYYDTGSFMHSNVDAQTLRIASRLKALGGDHEICVKKQFHTASIKKLKLWGRGLSRIEINNKKAAVSAITAQDLEDLKADMEDVSGLINLLSHTEEAKFCILLTEDGKGNIKGSMRTQDDELDLSAMAQLFGGGGHKKAAGFTIPGQLQQKMTWVIM